MPNFNCQVSGSALAFIDSQVADYQSLIAGVKPGTEVVVLDGNRDAIDQITQILALRTNIDSIHIVSHGAPGSLQLGKTRLGSENLETYAEKLQQWRSALTLGADILIYGCNVASGPRICPKVRRGINSPSHSASRLKPTGDHLNKQLNKQSSSEDFRYETGVETNGGSEEYARDDRRAIDNECAIDLENAKDREYAIDVSRIYPKVRRGINSPSHSASRLKPTENKAGIQSSSEDFRYETGVSTPGGTDEYAINDRRAIDPKYAIDRENAIIDRECAKDARRAIDNQYAIDRKHKIDGFTFIQRIAQLTNTNVAASKNLTGSAAKGGDWELEVTTGKIAASLAFRPEVLAAYNHVLATLSEARNYSSGQGRISDIGTGDFNGDGFLDLVVPMGENNFPKDLAILLGTGTTGSFGTPISLFKPGKENPNGVAVGDFNGDGKLDLATTNFGFSNNGNFVSIRLGTGTGSFGDPTNFGQGIDHKSIVTGDFNGDGKLDLATTPYSIFDNFISILFGDGTGSFGTPVKISTQTPKFTVATADFNGDGKVRFVQSKPRNWGMTGFYRVIHED